MKKRFYFALGLAALALTGCQSLDELDGRVILTARMEGDAPTKTSLAPAGEGVSQVLWSAGDQIGVFVDNAQTPLPYTLQSGAGTKQAKFSGEGAGTDYIAVYPASMADSRSGNTVSITLPYEQQYAEGTFAIGSYPMVAASHSSVLPFRNLCSVIRLSLVGGHVLDRIEFRPNDPSVKVSGKATVDLSHPDNPVLTLADDANNVLSLNVKGVELDPFTPKDFYLVVPAQQYPGGFAVRIYADTGKYMEKFLYEDFTTVRSQIHKAGELRVEPEESEEAVTAAHYLTFTSEGGKKASVGLWTEKLGGYPLPVLYYSKDAVTWKRWSSSSLTFDEDNPLFVCGYNPGGLSHGENAYFSFTFSSQYVSVSGDVMSLINKDATVTEIPNDYCFHKLFVDEPYLVSAPELPATILKPHCYESMFQGCSALTEAPVLPAETLEEACYNSMFDGCMSLDYVKCLATDISARYCVDNWLYGVSATGTFVRAPYAFDWEWGASGIPSGWTVECAGTEVVEPEFSVSPPSITLSADEQSFFVTVQSNVPYHMDMAGGADWMEEVGVTGSISGGFQHEFIAYANEGAERSGVLVFCSEDNTCHPVKVTQEKAETETNWAESAFVHHSLGMRFTATWCGWCPYMNESFKKARQKVGDQFLYVSVHDYTSDLPFAASLYLEDQYKVTGLPTGIVDGRRNVANHTDTDYVSNLILSYVEETEANYPTATAIAFTSSLDGRNLTLDVDVYAKMAETYKITAFLLEDGVVYAQSGGGSNYVHDHIARVALTNAKGDSFAVEEENTVKSFTYNASIPASYKLENMYVLVWVQRKWGDQTVLRTDDYGDYYIDNCREAPLGQAAELETE